MDTLTRRLEEGSNESILQLPSALLEEKNLEIDHLNQQILQLQQELDMTNDNKVKQACPCMFLSSPNLLFRSKKRNINGTVRGIGIVTKKNLTSLLFCTLL